MAALAASSIGWAQFAEFAAPGSESKLYFSSSLPLLGSGEPEQGRIFSVDASGVQPVADVAATPPSPYTTYYQLSRPELSRDGTILIYSGWRDCYGSIACESDYLEAAYQTTVLGLPGGAMTFNGGGRISGNGRYLLLFVPNAGRVPNAGPAPNVVDLQTGQSQTNYPITPDGLGRVIADDGTVVADESNVLFIVKGATVQSIPFPPGVYLQQAVIDAGAQTIVYVQSAYGASLGSIHAYSIAQQQDIALFTQADGSAPFVTADGTRAMFVSTASGSPQVWIVNTDGTGAHQVTSDAAGVLLAAMSDDGTTGWYLSGSGRVIQVNLSSGITQVMIDRTPGWTGSTPAVTPGTPWTLEGTGFSDSTFTAAGYPLPQSLGGVTVSIAGINAPIFSVAPTQIEVQVPWEILNGNPSGAQVSVTVNAAASTSPFVTGVTNQVSAYPGDGSFASDPTGVYTLAVHQDWSALVTHSSPARPGEVIHLYGFGFGPVDSQPADGVPASANPLSRTLAPITCSTLGADNVTGIPIPIPIPVLFSGLAPGLVGYYQLDVQLPSSNLRANTGIGCIAPGLDEGFFGYIPVKTDLRNIPRKD